MRILLDTHAVLWWVDREQFLSGDPFDRLLIAQALVENIPLISIDAIFDRYGVARLW